MATKTKTNATTAKVNADNARIDTLKEIMRTIPAESPPWPNCRKSLVPWLTVRA